MFSLRRAVFRNVVPGGLYIPPPVLQQNRIRAIRTVASLCQTASPLPVTQAQAGFQGGQSVFRTQRPAHQGQQRHMETAAQRQSGMDTEQSAEPSNQVFIANISYGIRAEDLEREFSEFGKVTQAKIIYDPRGLSKGFGYVTFDSIASATEAVNKMHGLIVDGRRVVVQFTVNKDTSRESGEPSRTLFIGNLSFDITDKDLNDMFASIKNCLDVRVAIDRQTGLPRGFAHADFVDVASAQKAKEFLEAREWSGRKLRIDYSGSRRTPGLGPNDRTWMK